MVQARLLVVAAVAAAVVVVVVVPKPSRMQHREYSAACSSRTFVGSTESTTSRPILLSF